jgi:hypothetical protein
VTTPVTLARSFTLDAAPADIWPWLLQIGKGRAGWYFPRWVERFIPAKRRALWHLDPALTSLEVGQTIDDWGGKDATLTVAEIDAPRRLHFTSRRGHTDVSWTLTLTDLGGSTRVESRVHLDAVKHVWLARSLGDWFDAATIHGLAAGLRERLRELPR